MIDAFKDDFFWMMREGKGYFPWIGGDSYKLAKHLRWNHRRNCPMCHDGFPSRELIRSVVEDNVCESPLLDIIMKALIRAEIRLISRFIPQNSHEERLTGNLVSEMDNSIFLVKDTFREVSKKLYSVEKDIDFFYYDLSRGGKIEKSTGADLGLVLVVDLPDYPFTVKSLVLQAKKINGDSAQIDMAQYKTLTKHGENACAYLFYDMRLGRRCSPLVTQAGKSGLLNNRYEACLKTGNASFSISFEDAQSHSYPLSLFLTTSFLLESDYGSHHSSFEDAFDMFTGLARSNRHRDDAHIADFNGRLAILSLGKSIRFNTINNESLNIEI